MVELFPSGIIAAVLTVVAAALGAVLVPYAARRSVAQPLALAVEDEVRVLIGVLSDLRRLPYLVSLAPEDFAAAANSRIWATLLSVCAPDLAELPDEQTDAQCAKVGAALVERADEIHAAVHQMLSSGIHARNDLARLAHLSALSATHAPTDEETVSAAEVVLVTGTDRNKFAGSATIAAGIDPDSIDPSSPPLRRVLGAPTTRLRRVLTAAVAGAGGSVVYGLAAAGGYTGASLWLAVAALGALLVGSIVISLVDIDTLYIDLRSFIATAAASWLLTVAAVGVSGQWTRLIPGVVMVAATAVVLEVANRVHRLLRGMDGVGFGDTIILIATVGIPPVLGGYWVLGFASVMAGMAAAVIGFVVAAISGKASRRSPFALGPYLCAGWALGWAGYLISTASGWAL